MDDETYEAMIKTLRICSELGYNKYELMSIAIGFFMTATEMRVDQIDGLNAFIYKG